MVITCLAPKVRESLAMSLRLHGGTQEHLNQLKKVPDCPEEALIRIEAPTVGKRQKSGAGSKVQRPRTAYQEFISQCMKGKVTSFGQAPQVMQACAAEWRAKKEAAARGSG